MLQVNVTCLSCYISQLAILQCLFSTGHEDYIALRETVVFGASSNTTVVSVVIVNDDVVENEEVFVVSMSVATGQQRVDVSQNTTVSITSDDGMELYNFYA